MKKKSLTILNISLALIAIILLLNLFGLRIPSIGQASHWMDSSEPICATGFGEQTSLFDENRCCSEIQRQLECQDWNQNLVVNGKSLQVNKRCYTGEGAIEYYVNNKMYNYCKKEGYLGYRLF